MQRLKVGCGNASRSRFVLASCLAFALVWVIGCSGGGGGGGGGGRVVSPPVAPPPTPAPSRSSSLDIRDTTGFTEFGVRATVESGASSHQGIRDIEPYFENRAAVPFGLLPSNILAYYRGKTVGIGQVRNRAPIEITGDALVTAVWNLDQNHTRLRLDLSDLRMSGVGDRFSSVLTIGNQVTAVDRIRFPNVTLRGVEAFSYADREPWDRSNMSWAYDVEGRQWRRFEINASFQGVFGGWNEGAPSQVSGTWTLENPDNASDGVYMRYTGAFGADQYHTAFGGRGEGLGNDPSRTAPPPP